MLSLFGLLLFWFGLAAFAIGVIVVATKVPYRGYSIGLIIMYVLVVGTLTMGIAAENFSYSPSGAKLDIASTVAWAGVAISLLVALTKPPIPRSRQENIKPPG